MTIRAATDDDIAHVLHNMRAIDAEEQYAKRWVDDPDKLTTELLHWRPFAVKWLAFETEHMAPIALLAVLTVSPNVCQLLRVATPEWDKVRGEVFRHCVRVIMPHVIRPAFRRAQCSILATHDIPVTEFVRLGFVVEGVERAAGKHGQDFVRLGWVNPAWTSAATVDGQRAVVASRVATEARGFGAAGTGKAA